VYQLAGTSNNTGAASAATFPIADNEVILIRVDWIMALSDFSQWATGGITKSFVKSGGTISSTTTGTLTTDTQRAAPSSVGVSIASLTSSTVDFVVLSDSSSNTYNWFANVRVLHMKTNS
jgi:hypothetical protein